MDLQIVWFILIAVLFTGYFVLEGFDMGVGILLPFLGKDDTRRRMIINTIGPHWDGNEVWLITAGGAMFAAFPMWYATLFSGFYLALFLMLVALIVRGVAFEFRGKHDSDAWRSTWDWCIFLGSVIPAILWGVAFANLVQGVPIDAKMNFTGTFWDLLSPFTLIGGLVALFGFTLHGAIFLALKTSGDLVAESRRAALRLWLPALIALVGYTIYSYFATDAFSKQGVTPGFVPILAVLILLVTGWFMRARRDGWAFIMTAVTILLVVAGHFMALFPRVMISSLKPEWSLTIQNSSSSPYTLQVMTIVALIFVPIVLIYQGWSYWIFRKRITQKPQDLHY